MVSNPTSGKIEENTHQTINNVIGYLSSGSCYSCCNLFALRDQIMVSNDPTLGARWDENTYIPYNLVNSVAQVSWNLFAPRDQIMVSNHPT